MVDWRALEAAADKTIAGTFGETVRHHPMKAGAVDAGRPAVDIRGVLHTPSPEGTINISAGLVSTMVSAEAALVVIRADYPGVIFKKLDKIRGTDLPSQPWWEIKNVNDRYSSIVILALNQV
ncbi:hypothetical protein [Rhizobium tumorigenes]|uniref:hypothetical protein n=1 Tax=Rhizobium tumorigenes TaxID=2041385 RepID=UPI00241FE213|nr:hypothetical protein [Rhizobium tumorigenes]WFS02778.1 hypothetical protein PR016_09325 [Rhizobium tumorigenes]